MLQNGWILKTMLSERSQSQKAIPFIWNVQNRQINRDKMQISLKLRVEPGEIKATANGYGAPSWGDEIVLKSIVLMVAQLC